MVKGTDVENKVYKILKHMSGHENFSSENLCNINVTANNLEDAHDMLIEEHHRMHECEYVFAGLTYECNKEEHYV